MEIPVKIIDTIFKSHDQVFEAIVNRDHLTKYFTSRSNGNIVEGKKVEWIFEDVGAILEIKILKLEENKHISFEWLASVKITIVDIAIKPTDKEKTNIEISESGFEMKKKDIKKALLQTQGWTDFICSLKAYLYTGVNLRNGKVL